MEIGSIKHTLHQGPALPLPAQLTPLSSVSCISWSELPDQLEPGPALCSLAGCGFTRGIMDWLTEHLFHDGRFLGITWHLWKAVGWVGNILFSSRFFVQWWATEKHKRVVVPDAFWWLSLSGSGCLLAYALFYQRDSVFIFAYLFTWIPYIRNLIIGHRAKRALRDCAGCGTSSVPAAKFCSECGVRLEKNP